MYTKKVFYSVTQFMHGQVMPRIMWFESSEEAKEYSRTHALSELPVTHTYRTDESIYEIEQLIKYQSSAQPRIGAMGPYYNASALGMRDGIKRKRRKTSSN